MWRTAGARQLVFRMIVIGYHGCDNHVLGRPRSEQMNITIIGTGNMARGIGSRVLTGGHQLTVVGKDRPAADAVAADLEAGSVKTAVTGDGLEDDVIVLAVY